MSAAGTVQLGFECQACLRAWTGRKLEFDAQGRALFPSIRRNCPHCGSKHLHFIPMISGEGPFTLTLIPIEERKEPSP